MPPQDQNLRQRFIAAVKRRFWIRLHMTLILGATGLVGVSASKLLLWAGVTSLLVRYPLVALLAWGAFVAVVRLWLAYAVRRRERREQKSRSSNFDLGDVDLGGDVDLSLPKAEGFGGGGGKFSGGGASNNWGNAVAKSAARSSGGKSGGFDLGDVGGDEVLLIIGLVLLIVGIFGSSLYLIYEAPSILAEAAFEFALAGGLLKVAKSTSSGDWVGSILRTTWKPFTVVLVLAAGFGGLAHWLRPDATRLSEVFTRPDETQSLTQ